MNVHSAEISGTIASLVNRGVAITSTLAVFETFTARETAFDPRTPIVLSSHLRQQYEATRTVRLGPRNQSAAMWSLMLRREMEFEQAFVNAGGLLLAGVDPTGWGGLVAGFGDQRELELLVEAGLTMEVAIKIATANGARFLRENDIGTIAVGSRANLVVLRGDPTKNISDVRRVEWVMKDGLAYDSDALISATAGGVGAWQPASLVRWPLNAVGGVAVVLACVLVLKRFAAA
jgi:hypothetical protein